MEDLLGAKIKISQAECQRIVAKRYADEDGYGMVPVEAVDECYRENGINKSVSGGGVQFLTRGRGLGNIYNCPLNDRIKRGNEVTHFELGGFLKEAVNVAIPTNIHKHYSKQKCVFCGTSKDIEVDHKCGRKELQTEEERTSFNDYQAACKSCNGMKRQACKVCVKTGKRFDPKRFGVAFTDGDENHTGQISEECIGCYKYDPIAFGKQLHK